MKEKQYYGLNGYKEIREVLTNGSDTVIIKNKKEKFAY
jgi:hypothetical protein